MTRLFYLSALLPAAAFFFFSCSQQKPADLEGDFEIKEYRTEETRDFSLEIPGGMKATTTLNSEAVMQFVDSSNNYFLIVIEESVEEVRALMEEEKTYDPDVSFTHNYGKKHFGIFSETVSFNEPPVMSALTADKKQMVYVLANAKMTGIPQDLCYRLGFTDDGDKAYMLMAWSLQQNEAAFTPVAKRIFESLRLKRLPQ